MSELQPSRPMREIQREVNDWGNQQFGGPSIEHAQGAMRHLKREVKELENEVGLSELARIDRVTDEVADVLMLALQVAGHFGIDAETALLDKLHRNKGRLWEYNPALGFSVHVKEPEGDE